MSISYLCLPPSCCFLLLLGVPCAPKPGLCIYTHQANSPAPCLP